MRKLLIILWLTATTLLGGCSGEHIPFVHRLDIPQGNIVSQEMLDRLEPGLTKRQVRYIMGSPMIVDVFNDEEWIYLYRFRSDGKETVQRRVSLFFDDDLLGRLEGDLRAAEGIPPTAGGASRSVVVPLGSGDEDGGFLRRTIDRFKSSPIEKTGQPVEEPPLPSTSPEETDENEGETGPTQADSSEADDRASLFTRVKRLFGIGDSTAE